MRHSISGSDASVCLVSAEPAAHEADRGERQNVYKVENAGYEYTVYAVRSSMEAQEEGPLAYAVEARNVQTGERAVVEDYTTRYDVAVTFVEICARHTVTPVTLLDIAQDMAGE